MLPSDTTAAALLNLNRTMKMRITARDFSSVTGPMADLLSLYRSGQIVDLDKPRIILQDTTAQASALLALRDAAGPALSLVRLKSIQGRLSDVMKLFGSVPIQGLANQAIVLTDSVVTQQNLALLRRRAKGPINTSSIKVIRDSASPQTQLLALDLIAADGASRAIASAAASIPMTCQEPWIEPGGFALAAPLPL